MSHNVNTDIEPTTENTPSLDTSTDAAEEQLSGRRRKKRTRRPKGTRRGHPFFIIIVALVVLAAMSFLPWAEWTDGKFKGFSLISDLIYDNEPEQTSPEPVDPELEAAMQAKKDLSEPAQRIASGDSTQTTIPTPDQVKPAVNPHQGDKVIIEDYTLDGRGLINLKRALAVRDKRPARIAVIGDSYIEGDIFTMNLRSELQDAFGGNGVGYIYLSSPLTGFRTSVSQRCSGWTVHDIRKNAKDEYKDLMGEYFTANAGASATFKGSSKLPHLATWGSTALMFVAPNGGKVTINTDSITKTFDAQASPKVQFVEVPGVTSSAKITATSGIIALGAYLNDNSGVTVDCMSLRGNSGISHRGISTDLAGQMRQFVDYDLIIVEYGINALQASQKNYTAYKDLMVKAVTRIKECYPNADILIMGIGDRGQKSGGEVRSMSTAPNMVAAQRDLARETGSLFWDTREAMGGENAVVAWRQEGRINPDYIHLNAKGGKELGALLSEALKNALND